MTDRAKTLPELLADYELTAPRSVDILMIEDVPDSGNSITKAITVGNLLGNSSVDIIAGNNNVLSANTFIIRRANTPVSSSDTCQGGQVWRDSSYLYVAVANNTIKRVALSTF